MSSTDPLIDPLLRWLAIPSVSADPRHAHDMERAGRWICDHMDGVPGASLALRRLPGARHGSVVGRVEASRDGDRAPTVAVYGHFDVQPPGPRAEWTSEPFAPEIRDGLLYARGAADSKANSFILLEAVTRLAHAGSLPVNVELLLDGEEEIDGTAIPDYAASRPAPDVAFVCDGSLWDERVPCFCVSARGTLYYRITLRTAQRELHSGSYGGAAANAAGALIACLQEASRIDLRNADRRLDPSLEALIDGTDELRRAGALAADAGAATDFYQRTVLRSAIDVNSICAGDVALQKTAIPDVATADVSVRLGPGSDSRRIDADVRERLRAQAPPGAQLEIEALATVAPGETPTDSKPLLLAAAAFERTFGTRPVMLGSGGTLPLFSTYAQRGVPVILAGFASKDGAAHAADECFPLHNLPLGIDATCALLQALADA